VSTDSLRPEDVASLQAANRRAPDGRIEQKLVQLRAAVFAARDREQRLGLPSVSPAELNAGRVREAISANGALHVRGLLAQKRIEELRGAIDHALEAQGAFLAGAPSERTLPWFELTNLVKGGEEARKIVYDTGSVLAVDSPRGLYQLLEILYELGMDQLITDYFGERPALSAEKTTLRRVVGSPEPAGWHQDGSFLGSSIRSLNVWIALTDCGVDAPGLELVPTRLRRILPTGTEDAPLNFCVAQSLIDREFPGACIRPQYKAGDAMLFDHYLLHRTWRHADMPHPRYAIESWFFAPSAYPDSQTGLYI
jgi:hypothetical protein